MFGSSAGRRHGHRLLRDHARDDILRLLDTAYTEDEDKEGEQKPADVPEKKRGPSILVSLAMLAVSVYVFLQVWAVVLEMQR